MNTTEKAQALSPLVDRLCTSHYWIRKGDLPQHAKTPFSLSRLMHHVEGNNEYGLAQIEPGSDTTRVAILDLDAHNGEVEWDRMVEVASDLCKRLRSHGVMCEPWRSGGGSGIHLYALWDEPQDAGDVKALFSDVLSEAGFAPGAGGVAKGEIEVFPKQRRVPEGAWGSMVWLPGARKSCLLDILSLEDSEGLPTWRVSSPVPVREKTAPTTSHTSSDFAELRGALGAIPQTGEGAPERGVYLQIIFGIHYATKGSEEGRLMAQEWASKWPGYVEAHFDRDWSSARTDREGGVTDRTVLHIARQYGWSQTEADASLFASLFDTPVSGSFKLASARAGLPIPPDIVKGVVPDAEVGVVFGKPSAGKSFAVLDLAYHIALGREWRGRKVRQRPVFYIAAEGAVGLRRRTAAYCQYHKLDEDAPLYTKEEPINLAGTGWESVVDEILEITGGEPGVLVIDTLSQCLPGLDENSAKDMSRVWSAIREMGHRLGCLILLVAHAGKDDSRGPRGSSVISGGADFILSVTREGDWREMRQVKAKDDVDGQVWPFRLSSVNVGVDTEGDVVTSAVAIPVDAVDKPQDSTKATPPASMASTVCDVYYRLRELQEEDGVAIENIVSQVMLLKPCAKASNIRKYLLGEDRPEILKERGGMIYS